MGNTKSVKTDNAGVITNNVVVDDTVSIENDHMVILLSVIAAIKVLELIYTLYRHHRRSLRKKYANAPAQINV